MQKPIVSYFSEPQLIITFSFKLVFSLYHILELSDGYFSELKSPETHANTLCSQFTGPYRFNSFGSIINISHSMPLICEHSREALEHVLTNVLELKSRPKIR